MGPLKRSSSIALLGFVLYVSAPVDAQLAVPSFHLVDASNGLSTCPNLDPPFLHWSLRNHDDCEIKLEINGNIPGGVAPVPPRHGVVDAVKRAISTWNAVQPAHFVLKDVSDTSNPCPQEVKIDGRNCIFWDPTFPATSTKPASTYVHIIGDIQTTGVITEVDIRLNPRPFDNLLNRTPWTANPPCPTAPRFPMGIENVVLHELGHLLGLDHPDDGRNPACPAYDANRHTIMFSKYDGPCETVLHQADRDGVNYLYSADLGDAVHGPSTLIHGGRGPEHLFGILFEPGSSAPRRYQYEWMAHGNGKIDDNPLECEALTPNRDLDDGVRIYGECEDGVIEGNLKVQVGVKTANDILGRRHDYSSKKLYFNGWFDWDGNGAFTGAREHVIGKNRKSALIPKDGTYTFRVRNVPANTPCDVLSRFRLDWGEDVGQLAKVDSTLDKSEGVAQHGEVEDYKGLTHNTCGCAYDHDHDGDEDDRDWEPPLYCHEVRVPITYGGVLVAKLDLPCHEPQFTGTASPPVPSHFPLGGSECFQTTGTTGIDYDDDGEVDELVGLAGPACVTRSSPYIDPDSGLRTIDTEMTLFELSGYSGFVGDITLRAVPGLPIEGRIQQSATAKEAGYDVGPAYPASSHFDVYFVLDTLAGASDVIGPVRVDANLVAVPPVPPDPSIVPPEETDEQLLE